MHPRYPGALWCTSYSGVGHEGSVDLQNESRHQGRKLSFNDEHPTCRHTHTLPRLQITADMSIEEASGIDWDLVVLPGGMPGMSNVSSGSVVIPLLFMFLL